VVYAELCSSAASQIGAFSAAGFHDVKMTYLLEVRLNSGAILSKDHICATEDACLEASKALRSGQRGCISCWKRLLWCSECPNHEYKLARRERAALTTRARQACSSIDTPQQNWTDRDGGFCISDQHRWTWSVAVRSRWLWGPPAYTWNTENTETPLRSDIGGTCGWTFPSQPMKS